MKAKLAPLRKSFFESLYSKIARNCFLKPALRSGLSPNAITCISGFFGILGCFAVLQGQLIWAIIFINLFSILDLVDGDVAREKKLQTIFGYWLDVFFDKFIDFLLIFSISIMAISGTADLFIISCALLLMGSIFFNQFILLCANTIFAVSTDEISSREGWQLGQKVLSEHWFVKCIRWIKLHL